MKPKKSPTPQSALDRRRWPRGGAWPDSRARTWPRLIQDLTDQMRSAAAEPAVRAGRAAARRDQRAQEGASAR
ncbi:hypothetical protein [Nocardioides convexus]|uniref:hypothetical protein n=1 Tax=Nocardioides convexus TaxID=2712224 RepID=UPI0024184B1B|nr:hypothetical protein [Nocardioides convexus]